MRHHAFRLAAPCLVAATLAIAAPARADEFRAEGHVTGDIHNGNLHGSFGVAGGRDFTLLPAVFAGAEVSVDKSFDSNTRASFGASGRLGASIPVLGKIYAVGGYASSSYHGANGNWNYGAGLQHPIFPLLYGKVEYRHVVSSSGGLSPARDAVLLGIGAHF